ncbi:hypothetical protein I302_102082 [Kwoniella bestiolae CBS 10118]|uniref:Uncharacterized protein n=1 Tax=Kwoniella bestiolae CBS 10118 TaxID=1296100 RepID=A0A1B9GE17_9TREE|nr:hypothetical protein I302_00768 [Kwoniella bestiolae CBS 10118]OCF29269.1 hypothetical protein I302_00768 [Kwoniella bestiolae CBS 10118]
MFGLPVPASVVLSLTVLPFTLAGVQGSIKINFPSSTSRTDSTDLADIPTEGGTRTIQFGDVTDKERFFWFGPVWNEEGKPAQEGIRSWEHRCEVWVEDGFSSDLEFTLHAKAAGFEGPKDQEGNIKCIKEMCMIPEDKGGCQGEWVVPVVDSTI